ncbi:uncharacterized protein LOC141600700 [Silene latifolia]|uniref:uncharacterized protein LOC141600700 n=1 Tax=Silene latifolia TaxID=37657 RepID=UPI003D7883E6
MIERNHEEGHNQLYNDYFMDPVYPKELFRRRFCMHKHLFMRIVNALSANDHFFQQRVGGNGRPSFSPLQRCTAALRVLAYGTSTDSVDEYLRMSDTSIRGSLKLFIEGVIRCFGNEYLRRPNPQDLGRLLHMGKARGFPGMLGSIDLHAFGSGKIVPQHGRDNMPGEVQSQRSFWKQLLHTIYGYGMPSSAHQISNTLNDINVLERSPLFNDVLEESAPPVNFSVNGTEYNMGYYLADGIYPGWATFVKTINAPKIQKHRLFAAQQECCRKDVERAFGVLQARFTVDNPTSASDDPYEYHRLRRSPQERFIEIHGEIRDRATHIALKNDLIEHIWQNFRNSN